MKRYREKAPNGTYLISSAVVRLEADLTDPETKELLENVVERAKKRFEFEFCELQVQKNAFTMHITPKKGEGTEISKIFQWIKGVFGQLWNKIHKMFGAFWADRFDSELIFDEEEVNESVREHFHKWFLFYSSYLETILECIYRKFTQRSDRWVNPPPTPI
ncbi:MAG: hypothetical protein Ta2G_02110 [Termitinemataceae bacterium]|nr:MAG: hypothetical protein Ta2G_02110 [Termitinemataceae bacterium]